MPRGDGTGPEGKGPMTGRGAGRCGDNDIAGFAGAGRGRGRARGMGFGRGRARRNRLGRGQPGWAFFGRGSGRAAEKQDREQGSDS